VTTNPVLVQGALQLAAYVAAGNRDVELAAVATVALERLGSTLDTERLMCTAVSNARLRRKTGVRHS
jgi:hypothetical protein